MKEDLIKLLSLFAAKYPVESDESVIGIAQEKKGYLTHRDVDLIFKWKLQPNHFPRARRDLAEFVKRNEGELERKTALAFESVDDDEALESLRGLPQMKLSASVAVASCLLMALNIDRYTVIDRRANESLVNLGKVLGKAANLDTDMVKLRMLLDDYCPPENFAAQARDWKKYIEICRELAEISNMSLRNLDRALYSAKGDFSLLGQLR